MMTHVVTFWTHGVLKFISDFIREASTFSNIRISKLKKQ